MSVKQKPSFAPARTERGEILKMTLWQIRISKEHFAAKYARTKTGLICVLVFVMEFSLVRGIPNEAIAEIRPQ